MCLLGLEVRARLRLTLYASVPPLWWLLVCSLWTCRLWSDAWVLTCRLNLKTNTYGSLSQDLVMWPLILFVIFWVILSLISPTPASHETRLLVLVTNVGFVSVLLPSSLMSHTWYRYALLRWTGLGDLNRLYYSIMVWKKDCLIDCPGTEEQRLLRSAAPEQFQISH